MFSCIDKKLFKNMKFYGSPEEIQNVVGYVFQDIRMNGQMVRENWREHPQLWAATCDCILCQTSDLNSKHLILDGLQVVVSKIVCFTEIKTKYIFCLFTFQCLPVENTNQE